MGKMMKLILRGIALAMGIAVTVLSVLGKAETNSAICMLGIGLSCLAVTQFSERKNEQ